MADENPESEVVADEANAASEAAPETPSGDYDFIDPDSVSQHAESTETAPSETPPESVIPAESPQPEFSPNLLAIAEELGYPRDVALAFKSEALLKQHLSQDVRNRQRGEQAQRYDRQQQRRQGQPQQPYQIPKYELQIDSEVYTADDPLVKQLNAMNEHYHQLAQRHEDWIGHFSEHNQTVAEQLQQQAAVYDQSQQQAAYQTSLTAFDWGVAELADYADVLGAGNSHDLDQSSEQWGNRDKLFIRRDSIEQEYLNVGRPAPSYQNLLAQAAQSLFGHPNSVSDIEPSNGERLRNEKGQFASRTQRPTHRAGKPLAGVDKATHRIEQFFEERADQFDEEQILS